MLNEQLQSIGPIVHDMASPILPYRGGTRQPYRVTMSQLAHTPKPLGARQEAALERGAVIDPIILPSLFALFVLLPHTFSTTPLDNSAAYRAVKTFVEGTDQISIKHL